MHQRLVSKQFDIQVEIYDKLGITREQSMNKFAEYIDKNRDKLVPPDTGYDRISPRELNEMMVDSYMRATAPDPSQHSKLYFFNGLGRMEEIENEEFWKEKKPKQKQRKKPKSNRRPT